MPSSHNYIVTFLLVGAVGCLPCAEYPEFYLLGLPPSRQLPGGFNAPVAPFISEGLGLCGAALSECIRRGSGRGRI